MPLTCPHQLCTVAAAVGDLGELEFSGGQCIELLGTPYIHKFERCPILAKAVADEVRYPASERIKDENDALGVR